MPVDFSSKIPHIKIHAISRSNVLYRDSFVRVNFFTDIVIALHKPNLFFVHCVKATTTRRAL